MVLRSFQILLTAFIMSWTCSGTIARAESVRERDVQNNYQQTLIKKYYKNPKNKFLLSNKKTMQETATALRVTNDSANAVKLYSLLIKNFYSAEHKKVIRAFRSKKSHPTSVSSELYDIYLGLYLAEADQYRSSTTLSGPIKAKEKWLSDFFRLLEGLTADEDKLKLLEETHENIQSHTHYVKQLAYSMSYSTSLKFVSWQWFGTYQNEFGREENYQTTNRGPCLGVGFEFANSRNSFTGDLCFAYLNTSIQTEQQSSDSLQGEVKSPGLMAGLSYSKFVTSSRTTSLGLKINGLFFSQNLNVASSTTSGNCSAGCKFKSPPQVLIAPTLITSWQWKKFEFLTEFGRLLDQESSIWIIGSNYKF